MSLTQSKSSGPIGDLSNNSDDEFGDDKKRGYQRQQAASYDAIHE
jgi:hypothetical protein